MKEEINQLVKESLSEQDEVDVDADVEDDSEDIDVDMDADNVDDSPEDVDVDMDMDIDLGDESEESPIDLTGASDEELLKVFKAMGEEDGIIVTKDGEDIHLKDNDSDQEYIVKLGESKNAKKLMKEENEEESLDDIIASLFKESDEELDEESDEELDEESDEELDRKSTRLNSSH